ncbi:unnamed protein product, partial [Didymodactylos carnosus]
MMKYLPIILLKDQKSNNYTTIKQLNHFILLTALITNYNRSDNASVLGGHSLAEAEKILHEQVGITLLKRDYSEVQQGRDICDRLAGAAKMRLKSYMKSGNNVLTTHDIKRGFDYCGGIKNTRVAVAEVDKRSKALEKSHIPEISSIRSIEYEIEIHV